MVQRCDSDIITIDFGIQYVFLGEITLNRFFHTNVPPSAEYHSAKKAADSERLPLYIFIINRHTPVSVSAKSVFSTISIVR